MRVNVRVRVLVQSKFPGPVMECVKVVKWIGSGGGTALGLDGSRIVISGDSAGGGLTAAVGIFIKENKPALLTTIKGLVSFMSSSKCTLPSRYCTVSHVPMTRRNWVRCRPFVSIS